MDLSLPKSDVLLKAMFGLSLTDEEKTKLHDDIEEVVKEAFSKSHKAVTNLNDLDGCYAGEVICMCVKHGEDKSCSVRKTGWIFEQESEAQEYADKMLQDIRDELVAEILEHITAKSKGNQGN